jgi:hypothetical protein
MATITIPIQSRAINARTNPIGCMGKGKKYDQILHDLPESIRPTQGYIRDIAVDDVA